MITIKRAEKDRSDGLCSSCGEDCYADFIITAEFMLPPSRLIQDRRVHDGISLCSMHADLVLSMLKEFKREDELDGSKWTPKPKRKL